MWDSRIVIELAKVGSVWRKWRGGKGCVRPRAKQGWDGVIYFINQILRARGI